MKAHIGPIYLILGLMAVSALTIGAAKVPAGKDSGQARKPIVSAQAMLPSPTSFRVALANAGDNDKALRTRVLVIESTDFDARLQAQVAKTLAVARTRKSG
jgi:hypothetical protein